MSRIEKHLFELALVEAVKIQLIRGNMAVVPGLGIFSTEYAPAVVNRTTAPSELESDDADAVSFSVSPPASIVQFRPDPVPGN